MSPYSNALVGMGGPQRLTTNALQPQRFPPQAPMSVQAPQYGGYGQAGAFQPQGYGAHPMMYPQIPQPQQGAQWPNPHAGAYQEWLQRFRPGPNQTLGR